MYPPFLKTGVLDFSKVQPPGSSTANAAGSIFRSALEEAKVIASSMTEADWKAPAKMIADGSTEWETTRGGMAWSLLFDLIHHRGQLSVYIRPMGGKVPSIYGPSGDNPSA